MVVYLILVLLCITGVYSTIEPGVLVNQSNVYELFYDLSNRIECHNFTDIYRYPLIYVADDFVIPAYTSMDLRNKISSDCTSLTFSFTTIRSKQDLDPYYVTLQLFYHDAVNDAPQNTAFYSKSFCAPNVDTCLWDRRLNIPLKTTLVLQNGDVGDDGVTVFDLSNSNMLPTGQTLWVAIYVTVPVHYANNLFRENTLFWMTLNNKSGSTPLVSTFYNNIPNRHYKYKDVNNLRKNNLTTWTDATVLQPYLGIKTSTFNMAWSLSLSCNMAVPFVTEPPSPPERTVVPSRPPTPIPTYSPTNEPTSDIIIDDNNVTDGPTNNNTNTTDWYYKLQHDRQLHILLGTIGALVILTLCCVPFCLCVRRICNTKYAKKKNRHHSDVNIEMESGATSSTYNENKIPTQKSRIPENMYAEVSLDDYNNNSLMDDVDEVAVRNWLDNIVPVDKSVSLEEDDKKFI